MKQAGYPKAHNTRTCVGCGQRDDAALMVRLSLVRGEAGDAGEVVCDSRFREGRGAYVHPVPACVGRAPRALSRAFRANVRTDASQLGRLVATAIRDERIASGLRLMRAAIDAGMMAATEGEDCSKRPEAR